MTTTAQERKNISKRMQNLEQIDISEISTKPTHNLILFEGMEQKERTKLIDVENKIH